jgi:threonine dehydrogenase-like Zn-dependent dehydrogenase
VPQAHYGLIKVPEGPPDERFLFLSDVLPTAWQAVEYADVPADGTVAVFGLGPIGQMSARIARHRGARLVIGIDRVSERLELARRHGIQTLDLDAHRDIAEPVRELTEGRGTDSVIDAVGLEAHGSGVAELMQKAVGMLPDAVAAPMAERMGIDRLHAFYSAIDVVRRGGTLSLSGVYGGALDPLPMMELFDKQVRIHMGQANVRRWLDDVFPLLTDDDPLGVHDLATHVLPLDEAPRAYELFQKKQDGAIKIILRP